MNKQSLPTNVGKIIGFLTLITITVWLAVFSIDTKLHVIACNVGQGDAILIQRINTQILIDSGPNDSVLNCLGKYMPFWDRTIELAILTHPDKDHSGGYLDVFKHYKIKDFLTNDLNNKLFSSQYIELLEKEVGGSGTEVIYPQTGMGIRVGLIYLDILHPDRTFGDSKTNNYSIVNLLKFGNFKAIFTGDIEDLISDEVATNSKIQTVDYIKVPHHGSKNGLSEKLLQAIKPKVAVISVGRKNSYGHPHREVLEILEKYDVNIKRTDEMGDVEIISDGQDLWTKK